MHKCRAGRADVAARDLAQSLQNNGNSKLRVLPDHMPRKADKLDFGSEALCRSRQLEAHSFVDDTEVALEESQSLAEVFRSGGDIEKDSRIARISLLGEVKPEGAVVQRLCGIVEESGLPDSRNAIVQGTTAG